MVTNLERLGKLNLNGLNYYGARFEDKRFILTFDKDKEKSQITDLLVDGLGSVKNCTYLDSLLHYVLTQYKQYGDATLFDELVQFFADKTGFDSSYVRERLLELNKEA